MVASKVHSGTERNDSNPGVSSVATQIPSLNHTRPCRRGARGLRSSMEDSRSVTLQGHAARWLHSSIRSAARRHPRIPRDRTHKCAQAHARSAVAPHARYACAACPPPPAALACHRWVLAPTQPPNATARRPSSRHPCILHAASVREASIHKAFASACQHPGRARARRLSVSALHQAVSGGLRKRP